MNGMSGKIWSSVGLGLASLLFVLLASMDIAEARDSCAPCDHGSLCVDGRCIQLDRIERQSRANFDAACQRAECEVGQVCVNGQCFAPERMLMQEDEPETCLTVECELGTMCYRGMCIPLLQEVNGEPAPVQCFPRTDEYVNTETIGYPRCSDSQICENLQCRRLPGAHIDWEKKAATGNVSNICLSGHLVAGPGLCADLPQDPCRQCPTGSICLGGRCFSHSTTVGTPCDNQRCPGNARCLSGICVNL